MWTCRFCREEMARNFAVTLKKKLKLFNFTNIGLLSSCGSSG